MAAASTGWIGAPTSYGTKGEMRHSMVRVHGRTFVVGDYVNLLSPSGMPSFVARITRLWEDPETGDRLCECAWYFRPEDVDATVKRDNSSVFKVKNQVSFLPRRLTVRSVGRSAWQTGSRDFRGNYCAKFPFWHLDCGPYRVALSAMSNKCCKTRDLIVGPHGVGAGL